MRFVSALRASVALLAIALPSAAQDTKELEGLLANPVVTTSSKSAETGSTAPSTTITITAEQLRRYGVRTVAEALRYLAVGVHSSEQYRTTDVGARGVTIATDRGAHTLVLVDGHSVNDEVIGAAHFDHGLGMPIELVDHIEVVLGPGAVLYGDNAMLAVVNVITKRAEHYDGGHLVAETEIGDSYRAGAGVGRRFELFGEQGEVTFQAVYYRFEKPIELDNAYAGTDVYTGRPMRFSPDGPEDGVWGGSWDNNRAEAVYGYSRTMLGPFTLMLRAGLLERSHPLLLWDFDNPDQYEVERWVSADLKYSTTLSAVTDFSARLYGDSQDTTFHYVSSAAQVCLPGQFNGCRNDNLGASRWVGLELQTTFDWLTDRSLVTLIGADGRVRKAEFSADNVDRVTGDNPGTLSYADEVDQTLGVYLQHVVTPARFVTLNSGARWDNDPSFGSALSPRVAAIFTPWESGTFKGIYSTAFRAPDVAQRAFAHPLFAVPAESLEAETVRSVEAAFEQRIDAQRLTISVFRSEWENLVELSELSAAELADAQARGLLVPFVPRAFQYRNAGTIDNYGVTAGVEGTFAQSRLEYGLGVTVARAERTSLAGRTERLPASPEAFGNARVSYDLSAPLPTVGVAAYYADESPVFNVQSDGYPERPFGPRQLTIKGAIVGPVPPVKGLTYTLGVRWLSNSETPYGVGPLQSATPQNPDPVLSRVDRLRLLVGLNYDFGL